MEEEDIDLLCAEMAIGGIGPDLMVMGKYLHDLDVRLMAELGPRFGVTDISFTHHWNGAVCRVNCFRDREPITELVEAWHGGPLI